LRQSLNAGVKNSPHWAGLRFLRWGGHKPFRGPCWRAAGRSPGTTEHKPKIATLVLALPENVNYAVKSSLLLSFLESVPEVAARLKEPGAKDRKF